MVRGEKGSLGLVSVLGKGEKGSLALALGLGKGANKFLGINCCKGKARLILMAMFHVNLRSINRSIDRFHVTSSLSKIQN